MNSSDQNEQYHHLTTVLDNTDPVDWQDIVNLLNQIKNKKKAPLTSQRENLLKIFARGTAFITFSYGIDGVSIETVKYAHTLQELFSPLRKPKIHFIAGNFQPQASSILGEEWLRLQVEGIDGWNKWDDGKWFNALYEDQMEGCSEESTFLTKEIYQQAVGIAKQLGRYFIDNQIALVVPVNIFSNPGNIALTLGLVLITETLGLYVLNSNHDFYWEAGKPLSERAPGEEPGVRDHFFRNIENKSFFSLFELLYPWNGIRWLQLNINARQSRKLVEKFGFAEEKVFEISTCIPNSFFDDYSREDMIDIRLRMGQILSDGGAVMRPVPIANHMTRVDDWMKDQKPVILGARSGLCIDPRSKDLIVLLQPTRIVSRKRIERNLELIEGLLQKSALGEEFRNNLNYQLILLITGPTPKEHQEDLERVLIEYRETLRSLPGILADRIYLAFFVGHEKRASFLNNKFQPLSIETIYRMADAVVFPSETEGRGLPIIEAGASGIPIICSQYRPREVFRDVIGEEFPENMRIKYLLFPEGKLDQAFLSDSAKLLINPDVKQKIATHNREAVRIRYGRESFMNRFGRLLNKLSELS